MSFESVPVPQGVIEFDQIRQLLPVGLSFLFVDRVMSWERDRRILTRKCVACGEAYFQGHYPDGPALVPGVVLIEAIGQSALLLALLSGAGAKSKTGHVLAEVKAVFRAPVRPGDVVDFEVALEQSSGPARSYTGVGRVQGSVVVKATLLGVAANL